jgi:hypothetical protein
MAAGGGPMEVVNSSWVASPHGGKADTNGGARQQEGRG